jgi:hypothetical protein
MSELPARTLQLQMLHDCVDGICSGAPLCEFCQASADRRAEAVAKSLLQSPEDRRRAQGTAASAFSLPRIHGSGYIEWPDEGRFAYWKGKARMSSMNLQTCPF